MKGRNAGEDVDDHRYLGSGARKPRAVAASVSAGPRRNQAKQLRLRQLRRRIWKDLGAQTNGGEDSTAQPPASGTQVANGSRTALLRSRGRPD